MTDEVSRNERIKEASDYLRGTLAEGLREEITGAIVEDDQQLVKFHGMYLQDDRDLRPERTRKKMEKAFAFMIRVRVPGGVLSPAQWLALDTCGAHLCQRHHAADHAADGAAARHHQVELESDAASRSTTRCSTRSPPAATSTATSCATSIPIKAARMRRRSIWRATISDHLTPRTPAYREIWLDGETHRRRRRRGGRADLRQDLSAAQIQDRRRGAALQRRRCVRARPRLHRHPRRQRRGRRLERHGRRRHGHDPRRAGHLSAHRRRHGILQNRKTR